MGGSSSTRRITVVNDTNTGVIRVCLFLHFECYFKLINLLI